MMADSDFGPSATFFGEDDFINGAANVTSSTADPGIPVSASTAGPVAALHMGEAFKADASWGLESTPPYESYDGFDGGAAAQLQQQQRQQQHHHHQQQHQHHHQQQQAWNIPVQQFTFPDQVNLASPAANVTGVNPDWLSASVGALTQRMSAASTVSPTGRMDLSPVAINPFSLASRVPAPYHSPKSEPSPTSSSSTGENKGSTSSPEPDGSKSKGKKRKSSAEVEDEDEEEDDGEGPVKKTTHNMIEKRYRTNLNDKIALLRDSVPSLRIMAKSAKGQDTTEDREELQGLTPAHKLNKATVLSKATEYIRHLEKRNNRLMEENNTMQARMAAFEKLFMAGAMNGAMPAATPPVASPMAFNTDPPMFVGTPVSTPRGLDPPGMIPVPDDMKRILASQAAVGRPYAVPQQPFHPNAAFMRQQQIQQQRVMQQNRWANAGPYFGKLMVGSLAGLMFIEAMRETERSNEEPEGRGLFAVPIHLLMSIIHTPHVSVAGYSISAPQLLSYARLLLLFGAFLWIFVPSIFTPAPPKPKKQKVAPSLKAVPSLASPLHVRQLAWLTAIQTVWVPRHNFFLEAAALVLKTVKLSVRNAIGVHGYKILTGLTAEQEMARVKAWEIALDAQLAGGDQEINKSRLTLTLLASGTLPDTPHRLMLKALHVRVLLWEIGHSGILSPLWSIFATETARSLWNEARQLNRMRAQIRKPVTPDNSSNSSNTAASNDELPEHLSLLLEQDYEAVLNDVVVLRAHNLAWNRPTMQNVETMIDGMNAVVEDPAVRSPMDAVAAWHSCQILQRALTTALEEGESLSEESRIAMEADVELAIAVAPIGSNAQVRGLVARATLVEEKRGTNIATALQAIAPSVNPDKHPQYSQGVPPLIDSPLTLIAPDLDVQMALRCAMGIAHLRKYNNPPEDVIAAIESIIVPGSVVPGPSGLEDDSAEGMSLLGCTAAFRLMEILRSHALARVSCASSLERLAGTLRIWIGGPEGDRCGLDPEVQRSMVERCLAITRSVVGMELEPLDNTDPGYGSMSEQGDDAKDELLKNELLKGEVVPTPLSE